jgi:glycosyltransferase involved in cell wall biosynthesis
MNILLTSHQFFPQFTAGTEVLTYSVARELISRGHVVHVLTGFPDSVELDDGDRCDEYEFHGIHVYRFRHSYSPMGGQVSMIEIGYDNHLATAYFERIIDKFKPDLVHFFHFNRLGTGLIESAALAGIPRFMTPTDFWTICPTSQLLLCDGSFCAGPTKSGGNCLKHFAQTTQGGMIAKIAQWLPDSYADLLIRITQQGVLPHYPRRAEVIAIADRLSRNVRRLNQLNGILAPNSLMRELLLRFGVAPDKVTEAAYGIDIETTQSGPTSVEPGGPLRIGFIGTLANYKGCHVLIEAFKALSDSNAVLKIYGREEDFPDYVRQLRTSATQYPRIEFCGTFPNTAISQVFAQLDVLVVPSLWYENTPLVVYSAQAARCPVVASNLPGLAAVIGHEENGLLFAAGDPGDLALQLSRLIHEDGLLHWLSNNARPPKSTQVYVDDLMAMWYATGSGSTVAMRLGG